MARKIELPPEANATADETADSALASAMIGEPDASDLSVISPDMTFRVAGREITVREYRFAAGLRARAKGKPIIEGLAGMMVDGAAIDATTEDYLHFLATHHDLVLDLMSASIEGADAAWINNLSDVDGEMVLLSWWGVCGRFFIRRALAKMREQLMQKLQQRVSTGATSLPASSTSDMGQSTGSAQSTPSVS